tara:strand:- start:1210 stop:2055 length:846 start_codon:yes stop_codon:yes gene_type:complete
MNKLIQWHKNYYYNLLEKWNLSSYQVAWASWFKGIIFGIIIMLLCGCGTYQIAPVDKCCETDVVYLDEIKGDSVNIFTSLEFNTITLDFRPLKPRFYWGHNYGYWGHRPLWMDFDFYYGYGNYYSYHYPYYSYYYRPWNVWDWYMRPWRLDNDWYQGPFNNQGYNVVYNASRRGSLTSISNTLRINRNKPRVNVNKPIVDNFIANYKPNNNVNNNIRVKPNNNWQPSNNNNIIIKPNNNYKPSNNNYRPSNNNYSRPSNNSYSRPNNSSKPSINRGSKNPR